MPSNLDIRHLELIAGIVEHGSLTKAAVAMNLTQSALSHRLRNMEERIGVSVFKRVGRTLQLSKAGERLLTTAHDVLGRLTAAEEEVLRIANGTAGTIRISTECYTCYHWLPRLITRFRADHPEVEIQIVAEVTRDPLPALLDMTIDIALMSCPVADSRTRSWDLFTDELVAVFHPDHVWAGRSYVTPEDFGNQHLILYNTDDSVVLSQFLGEAQIRPERVSEIQITEGILELVKAGMGVTTLAAWSVAPDEESGRLRTARLGETGLTRTWKAVTTGNELSAAEERFIELVRAEMGRSDVRTA